MRTVPPDVQKLVANARSARGGFFRFLIVGAFALALAAALAWYVENRVAIPVCLAHGQSLDYTLQEYRYPAGGGNNYTSTCVFKDAKGQERRVGFSRIAPSGFTEALVNVALELEVTVPVFFVLIALIIAAAGRLSGRAIEPKAD